MHFRIFYSLVALALPTVTTAANNLWKDAWPRNQSGLVVNGIPASAREHWMRVANRGLEDLAKTPCASSPFGAVIVNHTAHGDQQVCRAVNAVGKTGDPTQHAEIATIQTCVKQMTENGMSPDEIKAAWKDLSLYTNCESCPMCSSAIHMAGFKEVIYGTSMRTIVALGRTQILIESEEIAQQSWPLGISTVIIGGILTNETDPMFSYQNDESAPCPQGCKRAPVDGERVTQCVASGS